MAKNHSAAFERALADFKKDLKKRDQENFKNTTLDELKHCIGDLQQKQHSSRRLQNLNRLKPFIEAMEQYGKVVTVFANTNEIIAYVWGPMKFLLQVANTYAEAFTELLDTYEHIGEILPLLSQYEQLLRQKPHMIRVLSLIYEDMLNFHLLALKYFQQPLWKQLFEATWKTYKSKFGGIISSMTFHRGLIESTATVSQIEEFQQSRRIENDRFEEHLAKEDIERYRAVASWLKAADMASEQYHLSKTRAAYPEIGKWLVNHQTFKDWFDPQFPNIPPLLWLTGIPGAGKTVLASSVIEQVQTIKPKPVVLFFYCKHDDSERDNFAALSRSILAQLLKQDPGLLCYFHKKCCENPDPTLNSLALIEELMEFAFQNCNNGYVILDGLDECSSRHERKHIAQWFRDLVEKLPITAPERLRCLFVSQDDGIARKDFSGIASIKVTANENGKDIVNYCTIRAEQLKLEKGLTDEKASSIAASVAKSADGMFLFAKLVWDNLLAQNTLQALEEELDPEVLPTELYAAYERIIFRIQRQNSIGPDPNIFRLLGWLVCAKRSLKWHEIQGMKAIDFDEQIVDHERRKFLVTSKDLCESLVEERRDGRVELVHSSIKPFLAKRGYIEPEKEEIRFANLCIDYLNLPALAEAPSESSVLKGEYAFLDYAVLYWVRHLEAGLECISSEDSLLQELAESLEVFINQHWTFPKARFNISNRNSERLKFFEPYEFHEKLQQATVSIRKQLTFFGTMEKREIALDLSDIIVRVRALLEQTLLCTTNDSTRKDLCLKYGDRIFKCPRFSCQSFTNGFDTADKRDRHVDRHERPFRCTELACPGFTFGFASEYERARHFRDMHSTQTKESEEFPTEQDIQADIKSYAPQDQQLEVQPAPIIVQDPEPEQEPQTIPAQRRSQTKQVKRDFICKYCSKVFTKKYNLTSHLRSHSNERPHQCEVCSQAFARESDRQRHMLTHGEGKYKCGGTLSDGTSWGCGQSFTRSDILSSHHKSKFGQMCLAPYLKEQNSNPTIGSSV